MWEFNIGESIKMDIPKNAENLNTPETNIEKNEHAEEKSESGILAMNGEEIENMEGKKDADKPLIGEMKDDGGEKISAENNLFKNHTFSKFGVEYKTDDKGNIYSIDGKLLANQGYTLDGHRYETDDKGNVYKKDGENLSNTGFVLDGKYHATDDNRKLYRVEKNLVPNTEYEINGYKYKTDKQSRIISAEGTLHMKDRDGRLPINDSIEDIGKGDQKDGDDRGHLIGDQFDGSNGLENMIPQDANINRNDFKNFEHELAKEVKDGKEVTVKIEPIYEENSRRPVNVVVAFSIDGKESVRMFPNGQEE